MIPNTRTNKQHLGTPSITQRILMGFLVHMAFVVGAIWLLQIVFVNNFYQNMITMEMRDYSVEFAAQYNQGESPNTLTRQMSMISGVDFYVTDKHGSVYYPSEYSGGLQMTAFSDPYLRGRVESMVYPGDYITDRQGIPGHEKSIYITYLGSTETGADRYLFIYADSEPADGTIRIIKRQFPYIVFFVLLVGVISALMLSSRITRPFTELTESARLLAQGDSTVEFKSEEYSEIAQLADSLNYATSKLHKVDEMRVAILANVSHDLRTPLTIIKSYAEMIKDITGDDKKLRDQNLDTIIGEIDRLESMVDNILHVSKLETEMDQMVIEPISLRELSAEIIEGFWVLEQTEGIQFRMIGNSEGVVDADRDMMYQVIYNYISNAINHIGDDDTITILISENRYRIEYSVIDKGSGIEPENLDQVWDRYYTDSENYKRDAIGTGLGLHIVRIILERHGFDYGVKSIPNDATRFYFIVDK